MKLISIKISGNPNTPHNNDEEFSIKTLDFKKAIHFLEQFGEDKNE